MKRELCVSCMGDTSRDLKGLATALVRYVERRTLKVEASISQEKATKEEDRR